MTEPDNNAAVRFLRLLRPEGPWAITAIPPDRSGITTRAFGPDNIGEMHAFVAEHNGRRNLYYALNPSRVAKDRKALKADIAQVEFLHVDIDARAGEALAEEMARIRALAHGLPPERVPAPTFIVMTGGGYQLLWRLAAPMEVNGEASLAEDAERYNRELERVYGGDKCHNIDRVLRLPGTVNLPDARKVKKGRVPVVAELTGHYPDRVYPIDKFKQAAAALAPSGGGAPGRERPAGGAGGETTPARVADLGELDKWGVSRLGKLVIAQGRDPDQPNRWPSRSEALHYACCEMTRKGVPAEVILGIVTDPEWPISESVLDKGRDAERYARRQLDNAREAVAKEPPLLHKDEPLRSAREFRARCRPTLMHYNDDFLAHDGAAYRDLEDATIKSELYKFLEVAKTQVKTKEGVVSAPFHPTKVKVGNVLDALQGVSHIERDIHTPPCWLNGDGPPPSELLACCNGLLHLPSGELLPATPRFFTRNALDFDYDPAAPAPERWLQFLNDLWGASDEIGVLQEIMGYMIVPDTSQQKIFLLVGPPRSGKGTISRVLGCLVGKQNTSGPTLASLARDFGLSSLIGKQLAIVSDMRLGKMTDRAAITENLLRISGEDVITADRKYKAAWTGQLSARFLILTNQVPNLPDDSGALANRLVPLVMRESFLGREDHGLLRGLLAELPGILCWAIEGWRRLQQRGYFELPDLSKETIEDVHTLGSPVAAFLRERCVFDADAATPKDDVWAAWRSWCESRGMYIGDKRHFGIAIIAAGQGRVATTKPRSGGARVPSYGGLRLVEPGSEAAEQEEIPF